MQILTDCLLDGGECKEFNALKFFRPLRYLNLFKLQSGNLPRFIILLPCQWQVPSLSFDLISPFWESLSPHSALTRGSLHTLSRAGESYGGKYVPYLAYTIHQRKEIAQKYFNFVGIAVGDGWTDPINQMVILFTPLPHATGLLTRVTNTICLLFRDIPIFYTKSVCWMPTNRLRWEHCKSRSLNWSAKRIGWTHLTREFFDFQFVN